MLNIRRILAPMIPGLKKGITDKSEKAFCEMSSKELNALREAKRIVSNYSSYVENPFKCGYGTLDDGTMKKN